MMTDVEGLEGVAGSRRLILGYDAGCGTCREVARRVEEHVDSRLSVADLRTPLLLAFRAQTLGEDGKWGPTLFEVEGEKLLNAWTGWRMGWALSRKLGPAATWRVMQALGEVGAAPLPEAKSSRSHNRIGRGQFLKGAAGTALAASMLFGGTALLPSFVSAATGFVSGTTQQKRTALFIVRNSAQFKRLASLQQQVDANFDFGRAEFRFDNDGDFGVVCVGSPNKQRSVIAVFFLDMKRKRVFIYNHHVYLPAGGDAATKRTQILSYQQGQPVRFNHNVTFEVEAPSGGRMDAASGTERSGNRYYVRTLSGRRTTADQFIAERKRAHQSRVEALRRRAYGGRSSVTASRTESPECQQCKDRANLKCVIGVYAACGLVGAGVGSLAAPVVGTAAGTILGGLSCAITEGTSGGCENYANSASGGCLEVCCGKPSSGSGVCG